MNFYLQGEYKSDNSNEKKSFETCKDATEIRCDNESSRCILREMVMDGKIDCEQKSDEQKTLECFNQTEFTCSDNHRCIPRYRVNDGFSDCKDSSDENITQLTCFNETEFSCNERRCIPRSWVRNSIKDCKSGEDETHTFSECLKNEFECLDKSRCLPRRYVCDGVLNCKDGSDEIQFCNLSNYLHCYKNKFQIFLPIIKRKKLIKFPTEGIKFCSDLVFGFKCLVEISDSRHFPSSHEYELRSIPQYYLNNNISICSKQQDRCYDKQNQFICSRCLDNKTIISQDQLCDNFIDCPDMSDECTCGNTEMEPLCEIIYPIKDKKRDQKRMLSHICNQVNDFDGNIDEKYCNYRVLFMLTHSTGSQTYNCLSHDNKRFKSGKLCDLVVDCPLKDDECSSKCFDADFNLILTDVSSRFNSRLRKTFEFYFSNCFPFLHSTKILNHSILNSFWKFFKYPYGSIDYLYFVENFQNNFSSFEIQEKSLINMNAKLIKFFNTKNLYTMSIDNSKNISFNKLGDFCDLKSFICPWRFYCGPNFSQSIDLNKHCDLHIDCFDGSDEMNCSSETHFYCWNGHPKFISKNKHLNYKRDCSDGSDEYFTDEFSSSFEMIKNQTFRIFIWFSSIITIINNLIIIRKHSQRLFKIKKKSSTRYVNTILLFQLSISDFMMGIVLLIVGIKSRQFSGQYCYHDLEWRSSVTCDIIGFLTVISSQISLSMLLIITILRVYVMFQPFKSNQLPHNFFLFISMLTWVLSITFALIPIWFKVELAQHLYIEANAFLPQSVEYSQLKNFYQRSKMILLMSLNTSYDLHKNANTTFNVDDLNNWYYNSDEGKFRFPNRNIKIKSTFGFYGSTAICFPDLYTTSSSSHFIFSLIIISYNTFVVLFIFFSYIFMFYYTNQSMKKIKKRSSKEQMHKFKCKVISIILSDLICWLPIIIMSLISYNGFELTGIVIPISAILLLPVNSAINPIIYSRFDKKIVKLYKQITFFKNKKETNKIELNEVNQFTETNKFP